MEANDYYLTIPAGTVYLRTCARYDAISIQEFSMTEVVIKPNTNTLYEKMGVTSEGIISSMSEYFCYDFIPVEAGKTYYMPHCRNTALLNAQGNVIRVIGGPQMEANGYLLTIPIGTAYLRTCVRYDAISVEEFSITEVN